VEGEEGEAKIVEDWSCDGFESGKGNGVTFAVHGLDRAAAFSITVFL
jgi:hypothetical protein